MGLQSLQDAASVAGKRVVAECVDGVTEERVVLLMAFHTRIEGGKRFDFVREVADRRRWVGGAFDSGLGLKLFELALDFDGRRSDDRYLPRTLGTFDVGVWRATIARRETGKNNDRPSEKMVAS